MASFLSILILIIAIIFLIWSIFNLQNAYRYFPHNIGLAWLFLIIAILVIIADLIVMARPNFVVVA
jgi:uncharacterized membrane protein HdeD (DUF308 family)